MRIISTLLRLVNFIIDTSSFIILFGILVIGRLQGIETVTNVMNAHTIIVLIVCLLFVIRISGRSYGIIRTYYIPERLKLLADILNTEPSVEHQSVAQPMIDNGMLYMDGDLYKPAIFDRNLIYAAMLRSACVVLTMCTLVIFAL